MIIEEQLIFDLINEDAYTQKAFYQRHFGYVMSICRRYFNNQEDALEVCQDVFFKIFKNIAKYDMNRDFKKWVSSITINTCIDRIRKENKKYSDNYDKYTDISTLDPLSEYSDILEELDAEDIMKLIHQIDQKHKTVFLLYVVEGFNHKEIGKKLKMSENTSKWHLAQARKKLIPLIEKHYLNE